MQKGRVLLSCILAFILFGIVGITMLSDWEFAARWTHDLSTVSGEFVSNPLSRVTLLNLPQEDVTDGNAEGTSNVNAGNDVQTKSIKDKITQQSSPEKRDILQRTSKDGESNNNEIVSLPRPLDGRNKEDPSWCTMANYRTHFWKKMRKVERHYPHELLQHIEMSFPDACVRNGIVYVHANSPDVWKLGDRTRSVMASTQHRGGSPRELKWSQVLYPYIQVTDEDLLSWGLPMDTSDTMVSISNYADYLAEFFKNGVAYLWALFKYGIITEDMWFVPLLPDPPGDPPGHMPPYIENLIRPFTKRCLMRFSTWLQHDRCYPRVHFRHWTNRNWTHHFPFKFKEEYIQIAGKTLEYYNISADMRPNDRLRIGVIKRTGFRQVLNHDEIVKMCNLEIKGPTGQEKVECFTVSTEITNVQTMALMRTLHVLVGVHGAGLLNGIFLNEGTGVLELFPIKIARWNFVTYASDLKIRDFPRLHYEGVHICNKSLAMNAKGDLRWQTTSQIFPWTYVRRRLQNVVNHLGDHSYPIIQEVVDGDFDSPACRRTTIVSWTKTQNAKAREVLSHQYLGLPMGAKWTEETLRPDT